MLGRPLKVRKAVAAGEGQLTAATEPTGEDLPSRPRGCSVSTRVDILPFLKFATRLARWGILARMTSEAILLGNVAVQTTHITIACRVCQGRGRSVLTRCTDRTDRAGRLLEAAAVPILIQW